MANIILYYNNAKYENSKIKSESRSNARFFKPTKIPLVNVIYSMGAGLNDSQVLILQRIL